jgi:hypothetical protein
MANKADTQAKAAELGIEFDDSTTVKDLEAKIAEKEAANAAENPPATPSEPAAPTPPAEPTPAPTPAAPTAPAGKAEPEFDVQLEVGAEFQIVRSVDGKHARIFNKLKQPVSGIVDATNSEEVEKLGRECTRHNAMAVQRQPRRK